MIKIMKGNSVLALLVCFVGLLHLSVARAQSAAEDAARQFFEDETSTLLVGEQSVAIFPSPSAIPLKRGVAVLFYETGHLGLTFDMAAQIGDRLNGHGWDTLLVPALFATNATTAVPSPEADSMVQPRADSVSPVVGYPDSRNQFILLQNAVNAHIADREGFRMIVAQGMTAALLLDTGVNDAITQPDMAVVLSPFWPTRAHNQAVPKNLAETTFPVLDVALDDYNNWALSTRQRRSQLAITSLKMHYRQQAMLALGTTAIARSVNYSGRHVGSTLSTSASPTTAASVSPFASRLAGRIYGWTTYLGW